MARKYCVNFTLRYYKNARQKREGIAAAKTDKKESRVFPLAKRI
jgi:hypothetical protein